MNNLNLMLKPKPKQLSDLMLDIGVYHEEVLILGVCDDTRNLKQGEAFLCLPRVSDVQARVKEAYDKGASAVIYVGQEAPAKDVMIAASFLPDMQSAGLMLRRWFETEHASLPCIGITGTDGKTSTAWMLREILAEYLGSAWSCGTLGLIQSKQDIQDLGNTTPSMLTLHRIYAWAVRESIGALVLEVSSHGIAQQRVAGLPFKAAIWTTVGEDHLEDHGGFAAYLACKSSFIKDVVAHDGVIVANADYQLIKHELSDVKEQVSWYGQSKDADLQWAYQKHGLSFHSGENTATFKHMPAADFHGENLASVALLLEKVWDMSLTDLVQFDGKVSTPRGRLEPVDEKANVFIDYAHTAQGLKRCLLSAKKLAQTELLLVFGCGGDRDKSKRPEMGAVAVKFTDECWLTSDNPRSEKQVDIAADILAGVGALKDKIHVCEDRAVAIEQAISSLQQGGILVIAGKGHETYMDIQGNKMPWSDKATALAAIRKCEVQTCI